MQQYRVGIVGCGEVAQIMHLPSLYRLADKFQVTALCDVSRKVLDGVGDHWHVANRFLDYQALVERADVDIVLVCNPHAYHAPVTLAAIAAGKHVLVEKPMCMNLSEADALIAAQQRAGVVVQVAYMRRYAPAFIEACRVVQQMDGIHLARVHDVIGHNALIIRNTSRVIRPDDVPESVIQAGQALQDRGVEQAIGSAPPDLYMAYMLLLGLSSHDTSAMRELLGMPKGVLHATKRQGGLYLTGAFDYGSYVCQFETGVDNIPRFDGHLEVYGNDKVVKVQYDTPYVLNMPIRLFISQANGKDGVLEQVVHPVWGDAFVSEWEALYENITQRRTPKSSPADFRLDLEIFKDMIELMR